MAELCFDYMVEEKDFNKALALLSQKPARKNLPDICIEGAEFGMAAAKFYRLKPDDYRGLFLGEITDCCQSVGGQGEDCAVHGYTSEQGGFYVLEKESKGIVAQTWAWRGTKGELVFDSLETLGTQVDAEQWQSIVTAFAAAVEKGNTHRVTALHIGMGGDTPDSLKQAFNTTATAAKPMDYDGYRDSYEQIQVWRQS